MARPVRLPALLPGLAVLGVAGLLGAHDATWSIWVGIGVGLVGLLLTLAFALDGRDGARWVLLGVVACGLVAVGTDAAVGGLWMVLVGRESTAVVTDVRHVAFDRASPAHDEDTVALTDGTPVAGALPDLAPGTFAVGDRVEIVADPTGLVRFPTLAADPQHPRDAVGGPLAVLIGVGLLGWARWRPPTASPARRIASPG